MTNSTFLGRTLKRKFNIVINDFSKAKIDVSDTEHYFIFKD